MGSGHGLASETKKFFVPDFFATPPGAIPGINGFAKAETTGTTFVDGVEGPESIPRQGEQRRVGPFANCDFVYLAYT